MNSVIFRTVNRLLASLLLVFSVFLLLRGHNLPGGGFAGGLVAAGAIVLHALCNGMSAGRKLLRVDPRTLIGCGLAVALTAGLWGIAVGKPFLTGVWDMTPLPAIGKPGTPLLFDFGVYLVVMGIVCLIVFALGEEGESAVEEAK